MAEVNKPEEVEDDLELPTPLERNIPYLMGVSKSVDRDETFDCTVCRFDSKDRVITVRTLPHHASKHTDVYEMMCGHCRNPFNTLKEVKDHVRKDHPDEAVVAQLIEGEYTEEDKCFHLLTMLNIIRGGFFRSSAAEPVSRCFCGQHRGKRWIEYFTTRTLF